MRSADEALLFFRFAFLYPAPGYRRFENNGTLYAVGCDGNSWSASADGGKARYMTFYYSGFNPQSGGGHRAYGHQVRCLQE